MCRDRREACEGQTCIPNAAAAEQTCSFQAASSLRFNSLLCRTPTRDVTSLSVPRNGRAGSQSPSEGVSRSVGERSCPEAWHWVPREAGEAAAGRQVGEPGGCSRALGPCLHPGKGGSSFTPPPQRAVPAYFPHVLENAQCRPEICQPSSLLETHLFMSAKGNRVSKRGGQTKARVSLD